MISKAKILILFFGAVCIFPLNLSSQNNCKTKSKKALNYYDDAITYVKLRNNQVAKDLLNEALTKDEEFADAHYMLAEIARTENDNELAEKKYKEVLKLCPDYSTSLYFKIGLVCFDIEKFDDCLLHLNKFISQEKVKEEQLFRAKALIEKAEFLSKLYKNPVPYNPTSIQGLSTEFDEYLPIISPDNELAFFTKRYLKKDKFSYLGEYMSEEFYVSKRNENVFDAGAPMQYPFNFNNNEGGASITIDNNTLFFTACKRENSLGSCDIYFSEIDGKSWGDILNLGHVINSKFWDSQPSISSDGKTLYFSSNRDGGYGGSDLYMSTKDSLGKWGEIVNLGNKINTAGNEKSPFIHQDTETLYFSSDGLMGLGGMDIFIVRKDENGQWLEPFNIGYPINSQEDDIGFFVSTNGQKGFFASNKLKGKGGWDIYSFDLYEEARPGKVLFIKGEIKDESGNKISSAKIEMINTITNEKINVPIDTANGKYVVCVKFKNDYVMNIQQEDKLPVSHYISVQDTAFLQPKKVDFKLKPIEVGATYVLNDINFSSNSFLLTDVSKFELNNLLEFLNSNPYVRIIIQGFTDNIGSDEDNIILSENRAKAVYDYLTQNNIDTQRLSYKGFGKSKPLAPNDTEEGRKKNRRTEFVIIAK